tara:strand:+ start:2125 stop:3219 length:1095 start_codon:yes stop_codon:yes gene_type:complete
MPDKHRFDVALEDLQTFLVVADWGSFTRAADHLALTQPAVSNRIRRLEAKLQVRLFRRTSRTVELTPEGSLLREQATEALLKLHTLFGTFRLEGSERAKSVHVAATPLIAATYLPTLIEAFHRKFPGHHVVLHDLCAQDVHSSILDGRSDFAVMATEIQPSGLTGKTLIEEPAIVLTSRNHPLRDQGRVTLAEALRYPLLLSSHHSRLQESVESVAAARGVTLLQSPDSLGIVNSMTLIAMVAAGAGIMLFPKRLIPTGFLPAVGMVELSDCDIHRRFGIVKRRGFALAELLKPSLPFWKQMRTAPGMLTTASSARIWPQQRRMIGRVTVRRIMHDFFSFRAFVGRSPICARPCRKVARQRTSI